MARGRKKKEFKAVRHKDTTWFVLDKEDNIVENADVESWHGDEYKYFGYKFQSDFIVDLIHHRKWGFYTKIQEAGSLKRFLGIKEEWDDSIRKENYEMHYNNALNALHRESDEASRQRHLEANKKAYKKHYDLAGQRNKAKFDVEMEKYDSLKESLENLGEYKALNRILKTYRVHLIHLLELGKKELMKNEKLQYKGKEKYTFSVSTRYFSDYLEENGVKSNYKKVAKLFNLFSLLGFFNKEFDEAEEFYKRKEDDRYNMTFFSLNKIDFNYAEETAQKLLDNNYKMNTFSGKFVLEVFGGEIYDKVFAKPVARKQEPKDEKQKSSTQTADDSEVISLSEFKKAIKPIKDELWKYKEYEDDDELEF